MEVTTSGRRCCSGPSRVPKPEKWLGSSLPTHAPTRGRASHHSHSLPERAETGDWRRKSWVEHRTETGLAGAQVVEQAWLEHATTRGHHRDLQLKNSWNWTL